MPRRLKPKPLETQIECIAEALNLSVITVRAWIREGMDPFDPDSICQFYTWKESRIRNRRHYEKPARRVRSPFD